MQYTITNSDWTQISQAGESCSLWLDQQNDSAFGSMDVRFLVSTSKPSEDDFTKARRIYKPKDNSDTILVNAMVSDIVYARCKDGSAIVTVDKAVNINPILQQSFSKDALMTTTYADDYTTRGNGFQFKKRISLTALQTLYIEIDITQHGGIVYSLPLELSTAGGLVFVDTYNADSSTGGTVLTIPLNLNGLSPIAANTTVKTGVTVSGTQINVREYSVGTLSTNQSSGGGTVQNEVPKILNNAKPLYIKLENKENAITIVNLGFVWYELPSW